jgi:hypothetical protein
MAKVPRESLVLLETKIVAEWAVLCVNCADTSGFRRMQWFAEHVWPVGHPASRQQFSVVSSEVFIPSPQRGWHWFCEQ